MRFIGITGGVGAGKSEILRYIKERWECEIYLADEVAHLVQQPGTKAYSALVALLGPDVTEGDGGICRSAMADRIFADPSLLEQVNGIVHPAVKEYLLERLEEASAAGETELFIVEAALLIEGGYLALVDEMWYIYADERVRRERLLASRGYTGEKTARIMASQLTDREFRDNCDFVIDNSGDFAETCRQIDNRLREIHKDRRRVPKGREQR
ncbi:MAG: dephospho-CoA kinase [Lachnospiraceae bacterium]|nr:dephospho-CoA kinase [Lachnospiraceae bacterium]